jgi:hypothetical protein
VTGRVGPEDLEEISGVVASRRQPGLWWVHNDSGDEPQVYGLHRSGKLLARYRLRAAEAVDWEDLALGPGPGGDSLYVGDIGDNRRRRSRVVVYRFAEPRLPPGGRPVTADVDRVERFSFVYPDGAAYDAETLLVDPRTGDLLIVTKEATGQSLVFGSSPPWRTDGDNSLAQWGQLRLSGLLPLATGGDVAPSGTAVILRTYDALWLWADAEAATVRELLQGRAQPLPVVAEPQGEAVGFLPDGRGYVTISEGRQPPINMFSVVSSCW